MNSEKVVVDEHVVPAPNGARGQGSAKSLTRTSTVASQVGIWEVCYGNLGRNVHIKKSELAKLKIIDGEVESVLELIEKFQSADLRFRVPLKIMQAVLVSNVERTIQNRVSECVAFALAKYANLGEFVSWPLKDQEITLKEILRVVKSHSTEENFGEDFQVNVLKCFALLMVAGGRWDIDRFASELSANIWQADSKISNRTFEAATLSESTQHNALEILEKRFRMAKQTQERELDQRAKREAEILSGLEVANQQLGKASEDIHRLEGQNAELVKANAELVDELKSERLNATINRSHFADDFETLRGEVLRNLTSQIGLLSDGVQALKAGHHAIAEEYVDRAIRSINKEVQRLGEQEVGA